MGEAGAEPAQNRVAIMIQVLKEAVFGIIVISLSSGILLGFQGKKSKITPYVRYLLSLILLLMLLSPLISLLTSFHNLTHAEGYGIGDTESGEISVYEKTTITYAEMQTKKALCTLISAKTGIPVSDITVELTLNADDPSAVAIEAAQITLASVNYRIMRDKVLAVTEETLLCPCTVTFLKTEVEP